MASAITHGIVGALVANAGLQHRKLSFSVLSAVCAALPDIDIVGSFLGISSSSVWRHRGMTHSLLFAFIIGLVVVVAAYRSVPLLSRHWWLLVLYFFCVTASHGILDTLTQGSRGVALFAPFSPVDYLCRFRPIPGVGLSRFFSSFGEAALLREAYWVWAPGTFLVGLSNLLKYRVSKPALTPPAS